MAQSKPQALCNVPQDSAEMYLLCRKVHDLAQRGCSATESAVAMRVCPLAQMVERSSSDQKVPGMIPELAVNILKWS